MTDRRCFECVDRSLRDILDRKDVPFGGISVLLGGDFRQTLPVKPKKSMAEVISATLPSSPLWSQFTLHTLHTNMRLSTSSPSTTTFASWLLEIGNETVGVPLSEYAFAVEIPSTLLIQPSADPLQDLIDFIYTSDMLQNPTAAHLSNRVNVCPKNDTAEQINRHVLQTTAGPPKTYYSIDSITPHTQRMCDLDNLYPPEYLNQLNFSGFPLHELVLKINTPVMLLRNTNPRSGLCNGTRLIVTQLLTHIVEATIIYGTNIGNRVCIPRTKCIHNSRDLPFVFSRKQFPLKNDSIQILAESPDQNYIEQKFLISRCYQIEDYPCSETNEHQKILANEFHINVGPASTIIEILDTVAIPKYYFRFQTISYLQSFTNTNTDFPESRRIGSREATYVFVNPDIPETAELLTSYTVSAAITDGTNEMLITLADDTVNKLTAISCEQMVANEGVDNRKIIPAALANCNQQTYYLHLQLLKRSLAGHFHFIAVDVTKLHPATHELTSVTPPPATPFISTPATPLKTHITLEITSVTTPPTNPSPSTPTTPLKTPTDPSNIEHSHAKRQLTYTTGKDVWLLALKISTNVEVRCAVNMNAIIDPGLAARPLLHAHYAT
ncbi:hypothetical protein LXL04_007492 [Taraxacum kok-saghyz]